MLKYLKQGHTPRWLVIIADILISVFSLALAYLIRFDLKADPELIRSEWNILSKALPLYLVIKLLVFYFFKIHKSLVRHVSTPDLKRIFLASSVSSFAFLVFGLVRRFAIDDYFLFPMSVLILEFIISVFFLIGLRFLVKLLYLEATRSKGTAERILIYGAGISGLITKRTIEKDLRIHYDVVGFVDDNEKLRGTRLEGVKIYSFQQFQMLLHEGNISLVILAIQNPKPTQQKKIIDLCLEHNVKLQKVPNPRSWINGEFTTRQLSKINAEDLLGRDPIELDSQKISNELTDKLVLVSGAAGSIGSGLVREILQFNPKKIFLLDQAESALYDLENEIKSNNPHAPIETVIGDIRNRDRMKRLFDHAQPHYVFHAAAYKHVPLMESNPSESVLTNVCGTQNLVDFSLEYQVQKFVMISTDKAVNPTNVMGASKRIAEMYAQMANEIGHTKFITTRFGNVLGSNGSVIPLFQRQIENGGPVTLTDERITRFFMTIPEACRLVLEAGAMGEGGEIYVFDMGESVRILDLAKKMIQLNGLELGRDIEIKITGLRPGEKLYEELLANEEETLPTHHEKILIAKVRSAPTDLKSRIQHLVNMFSTQDNMAIVQQMKELVPEFISNNSEYEKLDRK